MRRVRNDVRRRTYRRVDVMLKDLFWQRRRGWKGRLSWRRSIRRFVEKGGEDEEKCRLEEQWKALEPQACVGGRLERVEVRAGGAK